MFENKIIEGIHISRFAASWINSGGEFFDVIFRNWLRSLVINGRKLTEEEVREIFNFAKNGKLELEELAKNYIESRLPEFAEES